MYLKASGFIYAKGFDTEKFRILPSSPVGFSGNTIQNSLTTEEREGNISTFPGLRCPGYKEAWGYYKTQ